MTSTYDEARSVELYAERWGEFDSLPLGLLQWIISRLNTAVRLGPIRAGNRAVIATRVLGEYSLLEMHSSEPNSSNSNSSKSSKKQGKGKGQPKPREVDILLMPQTCVVLSFPTYRVVLCLDVSRSVFSLTDAGLPFAVLVDAVLSFVDLLYQEQGPNVQHVFLSIVATSGTDSDGSFHVWQGDLSCRESSSSLLCSVIRDRLLVLQEDVMNLQQQQEQRFKKAAGQPDMGNFVRCLDSALETLPSSACPVAVLFTSGNLLIQPENSYLILPKRGPVTLHVVAENLPSQRPVGHVSDLVGLALVAEGHGGKLVIIDEHLSSSSSFSPRFDRGGKLPRAAGNSSIGKNSRSSSSSGERARAALADLASGDFFTWQALNARRHQMEQFLSLSPFSHTQPSMSLSSSSSTISGLGPYSSRLLNSLGDPAHLTEVVLESYSLTGATVEHIVATRIAEGWTIAGVSQEVQSPSGGGSPARVSPVWGLQPAVTFCLKRAVTKLTTLVYEISFLPLPIKKGKATVFGVRKLQSGQSSALRGRTNTGQADRTKQQPLLDIEKAFRPEFSLTSGSFTIDVRKIGPYVNSCGPQSAPQLAAAGLARAVRETDTQLAALLGSPFLPGHSLTRSAMTDNLPSSSQQQPSQRQRNMSTDSHDLDMTMHGSRGGGGGGGGRRKSTPNASASPSHLSVATGWADQYREQAEPRSALVASRPSARRLASSVPAHILASVCALEQTLTVHLFGSVAAAGAATEAAAGAAATGTAGSGGTALHVLGEAMVRVASSALPHPTIHRVGGCDNVWLVVASNVSAAAIASQALPPAGWSWLCFT
jgi:hypothetical protein